MESPALYMDTTLASFSSLGKVPSLKERFIIYVKRLTKQTLHCFRINAGILSNPGLESFSNLITLVTSTVLTSGTTILLLHVLHKSMD